VRVANWRFLATRDKAGPATFQKNLAAAITALGATEHTVVAMNEIGSIIGRMGEVSTAISAAVEEQSPP
jgi:hypothetical protein